LDRFVDILKTFAGGVFFLGPILLVSWGVSLIAQTTLRRFHQARFYATGMGVTLFFIGLALLVTRISVFGLILIPLSLVVLGVAVFLKEYGSQQRTLATLIPIAALVSIVATVPMFQAATSFMGFRASWINPLGDMLTHGIGGPFSNPVGILSATYGWSMSFFISGVVYTLVAGVASSLMAYYSLRHWKAGLFTAFGVLAGAVLGSVTGGRAFDWTGNTDFV